MRLFDGHCDTAFELWYREENLEENTCHIDLNKACPFDAYAQVFAFCSYAGTPLAHRPIFTEPMEILQKNISLQGDKIGFAKNASQIEALNNSGKIAALLSLEGAELIGCAPDRLQELDGFCMSTLTWNEDNALAGCHMSERGLSDLGKAFVHSAQELGIYIDVSHLGEKAFWDLISVTQKPILASHSNCRALCDHSRNLTDDQLSAIAQTGGTVGLNLYVPFLGENANFETLRRHLEHMLSVCGETHVAFGGDLDGCDILPNGFQNVGNYLEFYRYLIECGYDEPLLDRIFYLNLLHLF